MGGLAALVVDPDEYVAASSAFARVRGDSRQVVSTLAGSLDGSSGMGGSDNAGTEWAHGYDEAAAQGLAAAAALSNACGQVSLLLGASGQNHAHADAASTIGGGDSTLVMGPVIPPLAAPSVPSAAGGSGGGPPGWSLVESLVGYAWPNGHQDQLRAAQTAWQTASESLTAAAAPVPGAVSRLGAQQSPEVPAAVATCQQVGTHLGDLSSVLTQIGGSCGDYAAHLDQAHHEILSELKDLIIQTAAIEAGGAVLAFFTVGLDEIAAQAAVAARIAIVAARIRRIIEALIEAARAVATAVRGCGSRALEILGKLKPLIEAGAKRVEGKAVGSEVRESAASGARSADAAAGFGKADRAALDDYTSQNYAEINGYNRNMESVTPAQAADLEKRSQAVSDALAKLPAHEGTVYRGADLPADVVAKYRPGEVVKEDAFTSASTSEPFPGNTQYIIDSHNGKAVSQYSRVSDENEVLFDRGTHFRVITNDEVGGIRYIHLKEVP